MFDTDQDGFLSWEEFQQVCEKLDKVEQNLKSLKGGGDTLAGKSSNRSVFKATESEST